MKFMSILLLLGCFALAGCGSAANNSPNANNANLRGANTNTGYVVNSETNVKPTIPANATNISPPSLTSNNSANRNAAMNANAKANTKKP